MNIVNIARLFDSSYASVSSQAGKVELTDPVAAALEKAAMRVDRQFQATNVQLSAYGQIKAGFAQVQSSARALSGISETAGFTDVRIAVTNFVEAFNRTAKTVSGATKSGAGQQGALAGDVRAQVAGNDLRRSVREGNTLADLKAVGVIQNKDGTLAFDTKTLENAYQANPAQVRDTLAGIGVQAQATATRELARTSSSVNTLESRSRNLEAQQAAQQTQVAAAQRQLDQQLARLNVNGAFASGVEAYRRTFSA